MKSYTDLGQSRKLAEFLPLKSADKHWIILDGAISHATTYDYFNLREYNQDKGTFREYIPCWSLAALLEILGFPELTIDKISENKSACMVSVYIDGRRYDSMYHSNAVDACYILILKLHELELLQLI